MFFNARIAASSSSIYAPEASDYLTRLDALSAIALTQNEWPSPELMALINTPSLHSELAQSDDAAHLKRVTFLLSHVVGVCILLQLTRNGFLMIRKAEDWQQARESSKALYKVVTKGDMKVFERSEGVYSLLSDIHLDNDAADAVLLRNFQSYFLLQRIMSSGENIPDNMRKHLITWLKKGRLYLAERCFPLLFALESPFFREWAVVEDLFFNVTNASCDNAMQSRIYQFVLERYEPFELSISRLHKMVAAQTACAFLCGAFQSGPEALLQLLAANARKCFEDNPVERLDVPEQDHLEFAKHYLVQMGIFMATRLKSKQGLVTLATLSQTLRPVYKPRMQALSSEQYEREWVDTVAMLYAAKSSVCLPVRDTAMDYSGLFTDTITDLRALLKSGSLFQRFLRYLDEQLAPDMAHLAPIEAHGTLQLFQINVPDYQALQQWRNRPDGQRSVNRAMNRLLLRLENADGYNLPSDTGLEQVPRLCGFVPEKIVNALLTERKQLFRESSRNIISVLHGIDSHRIQLAALRFFAHFGRVRMPEGKHLHDVLTHIVKHDLWNHLFDHYDSDYGTPHYLMCYLRNSPKFPSLHRYANLRFCSAMSKILELYQLTDLDETGYNALLLAHMAYGNYFETSLSLATIKSWLQEARHPYREYYSGSGVWCAMYRKERPVAHQVFAPRSHVLGMGQYYVTQFDAPDSPEYVSTYDVSHGVVVLLRQLNGKRCLRLGMAHVTMANTWFAGTAKENIEAFVRAFEAVGGNLEGASIRLLGGLRVDANHLRAMISEALYAVAADRKVNLMPIEIPAGCQVDVSPADSQRGVTEALTISCDQHEIYIRLQRVEQGMIVRRAYHPLDNQRHSEANFPKVVPVDPQDAARLQEHYQQFLTAIHHLPPADSPERVPLEAEIRAQHAMMACNPCQPNPGPVAACSSSSM